MGCSSTRENLASKMLSLKLRRVEIKKEREERLAELSKLTGREVYREPVPDYLIYPQEELPKEHQHFLLNNKSNNNNNNLRPSQYNTIDLTTPKLIKFKSPLPKRKHTNNISLMKKPTKRTKSENDHNNLHSMRVNNSHNAKRNNNNNRSKSKDGAYGNSYQSNKKYSSSNSINNNNNINNENSDVNSLRKYIKCYEQQNGFDVKRHTSCQFDKSRSIRNSLLGRSQHNKYNYDNNSNVITSGDNNYMYNSTNNIYASKPKGNTYISGYGDGFEDGYNAMLRDRYSHMKDY